MTTLRLQLDGDRGAITLKAFSLAIQNWLTVLNDLDVGISGRSKRTVDWFITDLKTGSACAEALGRSRLDTEDYSPRIADANISGFRRIEIEGTTPEYMTDTGVRGCRAMFRLVGKDGVSGLRVISGHDAEEAVVSARGAVNSSQLLTSRYTSLGSIDGKLDTISLRRGAKFYVYHDLTKRGIRCKFPPGEEWLSHVKDALGQRVNVSGVIHWNIRGEQVWVDVEGFRRLRSGSELPSLRLLAGKYPDLTGGKSTEEFLREASDG